MSSRRPADTAAAGQPDSKRVKVDIPAPKGGSGAFDISSIRAQIAAKKAEAEAKLRNTSNAASSPSAPSTATPARAAGPAALPPPPKMDSAVQDRIAAAKARIEALNSKMSNPYSSGSGSRPVSGSSTTNSATSSSRAAPPVLSSSIALHPLLMGDGANSRSEEKNEKRALRDRYKTMAPKFSSVRANVAVQQKAPEPAVVTPQPTLNPYSAQPASGPGGGAAGAAPGGGEGGDGPAAGRRGKKQFQFAAPGRFVRQGDQLRAEAKMEALKQRIAEASRKAGLDSEFDTLEKSLKVSFMFVMW